MRGKLGLVLKGRAMLSKSLIQFSVDGRGCVPSLLFDLRPNYSRGNKDNVNLLQEVQEEVKPIYGKRSQNGNILSDGAWTEKKHAQTFWGNGNNLYLYL